MGHADGLVALDAEALLGNAGDRRDSTLLAAYTAHFFSFFSSFHFCGVEGSQAFGFDFLPDVTLCTR